jgi:hypothetical protein
MHGFITGNNQYCGQKSSALPSVVSAAEEPAVISTTPIFTLYPNPTTGNFTIEMKGEQINRKMTVEVYGMHGEKIMTGAWVGEKKHEFGIMNQPHGLYFVKIITQGYSTTFKLVKIK